MSYRPEPIDAGAVALSDDLRELTEVLAVRRRPSGPSGSCSIDG